MADRKKRKIVNKECFESHVVGKGYSLITSVSIRRFPALGDDIFGVGTCRGGCWYEVAGGCRV